MSLILSISSVLSFLSFLTTVLALARVGAAAFASNQTHVQQQLQRLQLIAAGGDGSGDSLMLGRGPRLTLTDGEKGEGEFVDEKLKGLVGSSGEYVRMPSGWNVMRRPRLTYPSPAYLEEQQQQPLSMAKLIMSRHSIRRPNRPPSPRRPPGLSPNPSRRSRLVEEAAV